MNQTLPLEQLGLPLNDVRRNPTDSVEQAFLAFHAANPHVYKALAHMALGQSRAGKDRGSINQMFEVLRWSSLATTGEEWKLNNSYRALYARRLMDDEPELDGFFETRQRRAA